MIERLLIATEIHDDVARDTFWHFLQNCCPELVVGQTCEIDVSTWDDDSWREWESELESKQQLLDADIDKVVVWKIPTSDISVQTIGHW